MFCSAEDAVEKFEVEGDSAELREQVCAAFNHFYDALSAARARDPDMDPVITSALTASMQSILCGKSLVSGERLAPSADTPQMRVDRLAQAADTLDIEA